MPKPERHVLVCLNVRPPGNPKGCCSDKGCCEGCPDCKCDKGCCDNCADGCDCNC